MRVPRPRIRLPQNRVLRWVVLPGAAIAIVGAIAIGVVALVYELNKPHNVYNQNVSFTAPTPTAPTPTPTPTTTKPKRKPVVSNFSWPLYGYTLNRTRDYSSAPAVLQPPFKIGWRHGGNALLEFSPSIYGDSIYYMDDGATVKRLNIHTGHEIWHRGIGTLSAATPALDPKDKLLFVPTLSDTGHSPGNGRFAALSMTTGKLRWSLPLPAGGESSPVYNDGTVYFGSQTGAVYAVNARSGHVKWVFHAAGAVKGGPALSGGLLYFGDYAGKVYAVHASNGKLAWEAGSGSGAFGFGSGTFYGTPAVAFGRVYVGNTNGFVYSFSAKTGQLAWEHGTGAYVYSAAAVADTPGLGPTVYIGSYDGNFYAFNAKTGAVRWTFHDGSRISGAATIVGKVVYYSDFGRKTIGLNARTGDERFVFNDGAYTPMVATPTALYLDGNYTLYELLPKHAAGGHQRSGSKQTPHTSSSRKKPKSS